MGSARHDGTLELFRKSPPRDPAAAVPEAIALTAMLDNLPSPDDPSPEGLWPARRSPASRMQA